VKAAVALVLVVAAAAAAVLALSGSGPGARGPSGSAAASALRDDDPLDMGTASAPLAVDLENAKQVVVPPFKRDQLPAAGLLFDVDTGQVLWSRNPTVRRPIASLTKIMTAIVVSDRIPAGARVKVSKFDARAPGSAVGALPVGKRIGVETMLYGLMLASGNDTARALARRAGGSQKGFVKRMNAYVKLLGLQCTHYATPDGYMNRDNYSCAADLAAEARALLRDPRLARIVKRRSVILPWPVKRGKRKKLELYNHNPLLLQNYPGVTGVKTGYTDAAGSCFVVTAKRGDVHLGVVLLDSPDIDGQAKSLFSRGFRALGV
jgi:serine-type D-Ala-D-Ala carboxypeptidase (penicillin-binding protein 5/6)